MDQSTEVSEQFFVGDLVCLKTKQYSVGTVQRIAWMGDSDDEHWEYFSDYSDEDAEEPLEENHVEVLWSNLKVTDLHVSKLKVLDRGLVHGDIATSVKDPVGQTGTVIDVVLSVDIIMTKSGQRISKVFPKYLADIHPFMCGRHVTKKDTPNQIGTIDDVICDIECKFSDGSKCILRKATPKILKILEDDVSDDEMEPERNYLYYPNQLVAATRAVWDTAEWIIKPKAKNESGRKKKEKQRIQATVTKVTPVLVVVYWHKEGQNRSTEEELKPEELIVLNHFRHTQFTSGDYAMIHPDVKNHFLSQTVLNVVPHVKKKPTAKQALKAKQMQQKAAAANAEAAMESVLSNTTANHDQLVEAISGWPGTESDVCSITATNTYVKVQWQDGTNSEWMHSTELIPRKHLLDCEFWPGKFVQTSQGQTTGFIKTVNSRDGTATVKWLKDGKETLEELSVYDIKEPAEKKFRLGGCVKSLKENDVGEVLDISGPVISVAWSSQKISSVNQEDLLAIDTDDEDEGPDEEEKEFLRKRELKLLQSLKEKNPTDFEPDPSEIVPPSVRTEAEFEIDPNWVPTSSFEMVPNCTDHHFKDQAAPPRLGRVIAKEWKKLASGLPAGIHVVSYNDRMDLLKAIIIGPQDTVFFSSFFMFDIGLPVDYPLTPPKVFYNSCGHKINPNLYDDGTVCLSLLGTWSGDSTERWHSQTSSIFQLVVSLQGLILGVKDPYFLEAGYDKLKGTKQGQLSSRIYNERAILLSLKMMSQYFRQPPPDFKHVVQHHFRHTAQHAIALADVCALLLNSATQLTPNQAEVLTRFNLHNNPSKGFLLPMANDIKPLFSKLLKEALEMQPTKEQNTA